MIRNAKDFGQMAAQARKGLGITRRELALAINSGARFIADLEAGKATAQLGKAHAAAQAAGLRLGDSCGHAGRRRHAGYLRRGNFRAAPPGPGPIPMRRKKIRLRTDTNPR
ncbi:MAG: hypothetical protein WEA77_13115 [Hyphomonas sp.]|uniref:hypothetical protein n=1 Tax=Hyphomonas sp. TaxID=87 RepID=UPI0034A00729